MNYLENERLFALTRCLVGLYFLYFFYALYTRTPGLWLIDPESRQMPATLKAFILLGFISSSCFFTAATTRYAAAIMLLSYQVILVRLPILREVQAPYLSAILVVFLLFLGEQKSRWLCHLDHSDFWRPILMIAIYFGFSVSGISKAYYPDWLNGMALTDLCSNGAIAAHFCHHLPRIMGSYVVLFVEISAFPLALNKFTRPITWGLNTFLHLGVLLLLPLTSVSIGVLILQLFIFDPNWIRRGVPLWKK